jgi:hypothetical protein
MDDKALNAFLKLVEEANLHEMEAVLLVEREIGADGSTICWCLTEKGWEWINLLTNLIPDDVGIVRNARRTRVIKPLEH